MSRRTALFQRGLPVWPISLLWTLAWGLWGLSRQHSVWRDEAATWQVARRSVTDIWRLLGHVDAVHGLYYLLMHELFGWFGPGTATLRLPSVLATAVAAAFVTVIGHRLAGVRAGLAGGLVFGLLPSVQFYLQEGRPYALVAAGAGLSTLLLVTALQGRERRTLWAAYAVTVSVCGLLNWLSLLILPAHLSSLAWTRAGRRTWTRWTVAATAAATAVLPLILFTLGQSEQVSWIPPLTWHMLIGPAVLLAVGTAGALMERPGARRPSLAAIALPLLAVPQIGLVGISLVQPLFLDRYVLFSVLGLALLIGAALDAAVEMTGPRFPRTSRWLVPAALALTMIAMVPQSLAKRSPHSRVDDVLAVAAAVRQLKKTGDAVLFIPAARRDTALVSPDAFAGTHDVALADSPAASGTLKGEEAGPDRIRVAMLGQHRILLVTDAPDVAQPMTAARDKVKSAVLREYFTAVADTQDRGRRVTVYERLDTTP